MKTWHRLVSLVLVVVLLGGLAIAAATSSNLPMAAAPQQGAASLEGAYSVAVELAYVQPGVYTDVLPTPNPDSQSPDLGLIDVGLLLHQTDTGVTGYVDLSQTLVFTQEHIIQATPVAAAEGAALVALAVGPQVSGSFDGTNLR
ncbi:MAG: hypothetical protein EOM24_31205, partial [Chloroflexia bacterium]|nr:hypothetical protein [Chloroflexia bacterium]